MGEAAMSEKADIVAENCFVREDSAREALSEARRQTFRLEELILQREREKVELTFASEAYSLQVSKLELKVRQLEAAIKRHRATSSGRKRVVGGVSESSTVSPAGKYKREEELKTVIEKQKQIIKT